MNIRNRLSKLEAEILPEEEKLSFGEQVFRKQNACDHIGIHLRQDYPCLWRKPENDSERYNARGSDVLGRFGEHKLVIKGHCDRCGYDQPLWDASNLMPNQWKRYCSLLAGNDDYGSESYHQADYYAGWLITNGYLSFTPWPPSEELRDHIAQFGGTNNYEGWDEIATIET